jgi:uncharacterized caspase-like protein
MKKLLLALVLFLVASQVEAAERRIALVVGNANYQSGALPTPANDAGLVAQTLQAAGFDVSGARDLDQESLRRAFRDFLDKAASAGQDTVAYVYLSGYGVQLEGENYFVPVDARITTDANVSSEALRISDYLKPLAALHLKATIFVLDIARANPFAKNGDPLTSGLALVEPEPGTLVAFNAAPGTVGPNEAGPYSAYAQSLAELSREGGVSIDEVFTRVRLRVNQLTEGAEVPWNSAKLQQPLELFERAPDAPPPAVSAEQTSSIRSKPIRDFDARDAYLAALDRDTLEGYLDFVAAYPNDPLAPRVRAIIAARREAIIWRRTRDIDSPRAYWSYLRRYPRGAHSYDARRRLRELAAAFEPPPSFEVIEYDVPPPPPDEIVYVERPVLVFDDPEFDFVPPPPPPVIFLPPPPVYFIDLPPPPPPVIAFVLPIPVYRPVPLWVVPPRNIAPPPANIIFNNVHNTVVVNNTTNTVLITNPQGQSQTLAPAAAAAPPPGVTRPSSSTSFLPGVAAGLAAAGATAVLAPSLPSSLAQKAVATPSPPPAAPAKPLAPGRVIRVQSTAPTTPTTPTAQPTQAPLTQQAPAAAPTTPGGTPPAKATKPGSPQQQNKLQVGQPLPGAPGAKPLPPANGRPAPSNPPIGTAPPPPSQPTPAPQAAPPSAARPPQRQPPKPAATPPRQAAPTAPSTARPKRPAPPVSPPPAAAPEKRPPPPAPPQATRPAPPAARSAPPAQARPAPPRLTPPPPAAARPAPPPPAAARPAPPPPAVARPAPPPAAAARPAPPPPPAAARPTPPAQARPAPPRPAPPPPAAARPAPPPPAVARPAPPPPAAARPAPPPPAAARPAAPPPRPATPPPPAAAKGKPPQKCVLPNGQPCPAR